jgi:hypothetical protein
MLHDLRCTEENPATYEKILSQKNQNIDIISTPNKLSPFPNGFRKSDGDGTSSDIKKNIKSNGEEEYIETKYDAEGNIISRKKTENMDINSIQKKLNFKEVSEFYENDDESNTDSNNDLDNIHNNIEIEQNNYYIDPTIELNNEQIIYTTAIPREIIYEAPAKYDPNITINQPIEETIINSDGNLSDNIMNDLIRSTIIKERNNNISINLNNDIYNNLNEISNYDNYERNNRLYEYNTNNVINNINSNINDNYIDMSMNYGDILKRSAEN